MDFDKFERQNNLHFWILLHFTKDGIQDTLEEI